MMSVFGTIGMLFYGLLAILGLPLFALLKLFGWIA